LPCDATTKVEQLGQSGDVVSVGVRERYEVCLMDFAFEEGSTTIARIEQNAVRLIEYPCRNQRCGKDDQAGRIHIRIVP